MISNFVIQRFIDRLPWRIAHNARRIFPPSPVHYSLVISADPAIVLIPDVFADEPALWRPLFDALARKNVYFLCWLTWGLEAEEATVKKFIPQMLSQHYARYPLHRFIYLTNNDAQQKIFDDLGLTAYLVNPNVYVDERVFTVRAEVAKKYDAIYNATMAPYKRHYLATNIKNLALITYIKSKNRDHFREMARVLNHATWINFDSGKPDEQTYRIIPNTEVAQRLNESKIGLCLSKEEGAMLASMEYLLCGLPIVSTRSIGGRDVFFDSDYVRIVDTTPEAVCDGVQYMLAQQIPAEEIRNKTLRKIEKHRNQLVDLVMKIYDWEGMQIARTDAYYHIFSKDILKVRMLHELAGAL